MSLEPEWLRPFEALANVAGPLLAFVIGKATRSGSDRTMLRALHSDVEQLKRARIEQGGTLAAHTAMHEGYVRTLGAMSSTIAKVGEDIAYIRGRVDGGKSGVTL
jgi:hypothetical protein